LEAQFGEEEVAGDDLNEAAPGREPGTAEADASQPEDVAQEPGTASAAEDFQADEADSAATKPADEAAQAGAVEPEGEAEWADDGPPVYASDLKPDFGDAFGPPGGSF
jgi:hypothetical protein